MDERVGDGVLRASVAGRELFVDADEAVIGRRDDATIRVDHELVSRSHAVLRRTGTTWVLEDLGSSNGTFVDGVRVDRVEIVSVTAVRLGDPETGPLVELHPTPQNEPAVAAGKLTMIYRPAATTVRIGRAPDNDLVIDDLLVSRHHAELGVGEDGRAEISDAGSHNGTFVNGQLVDRAAVRELDVIGIGHHQLRYVGGALEEYVDSGEITFEAVGLTVRLPDGRTLLDDVGFALDRNMFLAVVGPSGSGKSTLLNALTGFSPADEGRVLYDGRDLYAEYEELRQRLGLVPQADIVQPELTVRRALEFAAALRFPPDVTRAQRRERVEEVLAELGLTERADVVIEKLSGGQRKRVSVAYELLTRPSLLLLDEPTSGLDPGYERSLMASLRALADDGRTVIVVTHSIASIELCDRVLFLAPGGRVAYFGPPRRAAEFFGRNDVEEVFQDLGAETERDWTGEFKITDDYRRFVAEPMAQPPPAPVAAVMGASRGLARRRWWRQFTTLCRRYLAVIASDRRTLALLVLQAPVLGLLMLWRLPSGELGPPPQDTLRLLSSASIVIFNLVIGATWIGMSSSAREIVRELPQFRRERAAGLSLSAYLASKVAVLGVITMLQIIVYVLIATAAQHGPNDAVALGSGRLELAVDVAVAAFAGMCLGLLVSAAVRTSEQAMTVLPVVLIAQMVLASGAVFPDVAERVGLRQAREVVGAQWGFSAAAATADLNRIQAFNNRVRALREVNLDKPGQIVDAIAQPAKGPTRWAHRVGPWLTDIAVMLVLSLAALIAAGLVLARRDPGPAP
jgi:ABC-type multidrug transport system ATPase subunit/pSer/pThr/pTyr-binding forkhead associated (FHA) protein